MRIRSIKPEFWRSQDISSLDWESRFIFIGLWSYVDDSGVGVDRVSLVAADLFADDLERDPRETFARVSRGLQKLSEGGRIVRYTLDGKHFLEITNWAKHQRIDKPNKARYPSSTCENVQIRDTLASMSRDLREGPATGTEEQGNRGTGEQNKPPYPPERETAPDRAPAIRTTGAEKARDRFLAIPTNGSTLSRQIAKAYSDSLPVPIEAKLLGELGGEIDRCLRSAIPPEAIAAGIQEWTRSDSFAPSQIPKFVHKAANRSTGHNGIGKPTLKAIDYDTAAEQLIAALETP